MPTGPGLPGEVNPRTNPLGGMTPEAQRALLVKVKTKAIKELLRSVIKRLKR